MASEGYEKIKSQLLGKTERINSFASSLNKLSPEKASSELKALYNAAIEGKNLAETAFNETLDITVQAHQILFCIEFAEMYVRKAKQSMSLAANIKYSALYDFVAIENRRVGDIALLNALIEAYNDDYIELPEQSNDKLINLLLEARSEYNTLERNIYQKLCTNKDSINKTMSDAELETAKKGLITNKIYSAGINNCTDLFSSPTVQKKFASVQGLTFSNLIEEVPTLISDKTSFNDAFNTYSYYLEYLNIITSMLNRKQGKRKVSLTILLDAITDLNADGNFITGLNFIISEAGKYTIDCLRSWQYIHDALQNTDNVYNSEFVQDVYDSTGELCDKITSFLELDKDSDTDTFETSLIDIQSSFNILLQKIDEVKWDCFDTIQLINEEEANHKMILHVNKNYGDLIAECMESIDRILRSTIQPTDMTIDVADETSIADMLDKQSAVASFNGTKFIYPIKYEYLKSEDSHYGLWSFDEWSFVILYDVNIRNDKSNLALTYMAKYISKLIPTPEDSELSVYPEIYRYCIQNVLAKNMLKSDDMSDEAAGNIKKYQKVIDKKVDLQRKYGLAVDINFDRSRLMTSLVLLLPDLKCLDYIKFEPAIKNIYDGKSSENVEFDKFLRFVCIKALLKDRSNLESNITKAVTMLERNNFESVKTLYLRHVLYEAINQLIDSKYEDTDYQTILRDYYDLYLELSDTDMDKYIKGTDYHRFVNCQTSDDTDNDYVKIPTALSTPINTANTIDTNAVFNFLITTRQTTDQATILDKIENILYTTVLKEDKKEEKE